MCSALGDLDVSGSGYHHHNIHHVYTHGATPKSRNGDNQVSVVMVTSQTDHARPWGDLDVSGSGYHHVYTEQHGESQRR